MKDLSFPPAVLQTALICRLCTVLSCLAALALAGCGTPADRDGHFAIPGFAASADPWSHPAWPTPPPQSGLPDLTIDESLVSSSVTIENAFFPSDDCAVVEGCVGAPGTRTLLRFSVASINYGDADLYVGSPADHPELFVYSPCHDHYHLQDFAEYTLTDGNGTQVGIGHKQAFCLMDIYPYGSKPAKGYTCDNQGISSEWADIYDSSLDCQWIDITDTPPGTYNLTVEVDQTDLFEELDNYGNLVTVPVTIP